jgi:uroporphyrinogen decarboxylase
MTDDTRHRGAQPGGALPRFLEACARRPVDRTPVWLMRQAGRYMAEYRELRKDHSMLDLIHQPELACRVTMQPIDAFDLDAAIIFADILPPLEGLGLRVGFEAGEGPIVYNAVRDEASIRALHDPDIQATTWFTLDAIKLVRQQLDPRGIPLIGFSGAPFTLASYSVEGGSSKDFVTTKKLMMGRPDLWQLLMEKLSTLVGGYLRAQAEAGAQALQIFDTWAGLLSPADYARFALPYNRAIVQEVKSSGVPVIYFSTGTDGMLELVAQTGADVIGVDWRVDLAEAWRRMGPGFAIQGNLDPVALLADPAAFEERAAAVLDSAGGRPGHIFNLGHGVLKETSVENVARLVDFVHQYRVTPVA